jgi:hypothetical protein
MGIGYALAAGLVKGFTQNIGMRIEERQAEKAKLDALEQAVFTSGLTDDFNNKNVATIQEYIAKGRAAMSKRGGIDIYGTYEGDIIEDDAVTSLMSSLQTTAKPDDDDDIKMKSRIEGDNDKYEFARDVRSGSTISDHMSNISSLVTEIQKDYDRFKNAGKDVHQEFENIMRSNASALQTILYTKTGEANVELPGLNVLGNFLAQTQYFDNIYTKLYPKLTDRQPLIGELFIELANQDVGGDDGSNTAPISSVAVSDDPEADDGLISMSITEPANEQEAAAQSFIASNFGATEKNMATVWNSYVGLLGYGKEEKEQLYDATISFGSTFKIYQPMESTTLANLDGGKASQMMTHLIDVTGGDLVEMAFILGAYQKPQTFINKNRPKKGGVTGTGGSKAKPVETAKLHAARVLISATATEEDFVKLENADFALEGVLSSETGLMALYNMADQEFTTAPIVSKYAKAFASAKNILGFFFDSDEDSSPITTNAISAVAPDTNIVSNSRAQELGFDAATGLSTTGQDNEYMTREYINGLNAGIERRRKEGLAVAENKRLFKEVNGKKVRMTAEEMGIMYARFESLRISLAFQMARAADPSGRLSNQDIIQQLARLGEDFDTPEMMKARIKYAIDDFQRQKNRYGHMMKYKETSGRVTAYEKQQIQGHQSLTQLARKAGYQTASDAVISMDEQVTAAPTYRENNNAGTVSHNGVDYLLGANGVIYEMPGMNTVTDETLRSIILSAPGIPQRYLPAPASSPEQTSVPATAQQNNPVMV